MSMKKLAMAMGSTCARGGKRFGTQVRSKKSVLFWLACSVLGSCGPVDGEVGELDSVPDVDGRSERVDAIPGDIVTVGHGVAIDSEGRPFVPDARDAVIWQNAQLANLEPEATPKTWAKLDEKRADLDRTAAERAGKTAVTSQMVEIDDNATVISMLLADKKDPNNARLQQINGFLAHKLGAGTFAMTLSDSDDPLVLRNLTSTSASE